MARIISLILIGSLIIASRDLTKSETVIADESPHEGEGTQNSSRAFEEEFIEIIECVRRKIKEGIPILIFKKSLDPLQIRIPILTRFKRVNDDYVSGRLTLKKFRLEGLSGFELIKGNVSIAKRIISFGLNFKKIKLTSKYKAKLKLFRFMDIYGDGTLSVELNNFDIDSKVTVKVWPRLHLADLFLNITLPTTHAVITGLLDDEYMSNLISQQLSATLTTLAKEEHERYNDILYDAATFLIDTVVNPALKDLSIDDLKAIIQGLSKNCEKSLANIVQSATKLIMDATGIEIDLDESQYDDGDF